MLRDVPLQLPLFSVFAWAIVARALLVHAHKLPPTCRDCGFRLERRHLGETICSCGR
jgi:hypothetical protein